MIPIGPIKEFTEIFQKTQINGLEIKSIFIVNKMPYRFYRYLSSKGI